MANARKSQIYNGESTKLWHCPWLRNGPISYRYEVTVIREKGLPDHAIVSDLIIGIGTFLLGKPQRKCLMLEIALYELPVGLSVSPDGN